MEIAKITINLFHQHNALITDLIDKILQIK
jgi:hypothetical protein